MSNIEPIEAFQVDRLTIKVFRSEAELALAAAAMVQIYLQQILCQQNTAALILATGNSQIKFLKALSKEPSLPWSQIICFHLDEYLGIDEEHPGSFRYYLREKVEKLVNPGQFHYLQGDTLEPITECDRYTQLLLAQPLDLCCLGIGKNGHLAFNEPNVANFSDPKKVKIVKLADQTRLAQVNQGYFPHLDAVPSYAFTLTIPIICAAAQLLCLATGVHKAKVIKQLLTEAINPSLPASVLRQTSNTTLLLDRDAASLL